MVVDMVLAAGTEVVVVAAKAAEEVATAVVAGTVTVDTAARIADMVMMMDLFVVVVDTSLSAEVRVKAATEKKGFANSIIFTSTSYAI